jgi:23S rRNA (cytosine1962-C5)-methyltransferase
MKQNSIIYNRLVKNHKKLKSFLKTHGIQAYRLYDKDIPEYPYIIDIYDQNAVIYEKGSGLDEENSSQLAHHQKHLSEITDAVMEVFQLKLEQISIKTRLIQKGSEQYEKLGSDGYFFTIKEGELKFKVNLHDYLDTGLFLDHRPLRSIIQKSCSGKKVLNLFSYTGSISVAAAIGGAEVTTVDMSNTYLTWARDNFQLNGIELHKHHFLKKDILKYVQKIGVEKYDIIVLDPPSFSNSKGMIDFFEIQNDHIYLINSLMPHLNDGGTLYFSNNYRKFKMDDELTEKYHIKYITFKTIPNDFRDKKIHQCFEMSFKK